MYKLRLFSLLLILLICNSGFAQLPEEPDLSGIVTIKDARSYYERCKLAVYTPNVTKDDLIKALWNVYYLGRRLGMSSMDVTEKYGPFCRIKASNFDEEMELNSLIFRIAYTYKALQGFLGGLLDPLERVYWMNIESDFALYGNTITLWDSKDKIVCTEYNLNGIKFVVFHNTDKNFAYDIKVYHKEKQYSQKLKKYIYKTFDRELSLLPEGSTFLTSSFGIGLYFSPSSFEIKGKYYAGNK